MHDARAMLENAAEELSTTRVLRRPGSSAQYRDGVAEALASNPIQVAAKGGRVVAAASYTTRRESGETYIFLNVTSQPAGEPLGMAVKRVLLRIAAAAVGAGANRIYTFAILCQLRIYSCTCPSEKRSAKEKTSV